MKYQIRNLHKLIQEDVWLDGCRPDTACASHVAVSFIGESVDEVIKRAADFLGVDSDGIERDACGETGRVDFALTENDDGYPLTDRERAAWTTGTLRAWYAVYTTYVERVTPVSAKAPKSN